ncbi:MAG TPA: cytochrome o ubiquinol oxidase subunit IV [Candidatus Paceibacterota bacterium]|nr:cytochrome o ubiquinol oxidase subunit IV [Candidatus Paceibacterota bacterium]
MTLLKTYILGFVLSIVLTVVAFWLVWRHVASGHEFPSHETLVPLLVLLALGQLAVQLICFLHVAREKRPRWNLAALGFAVLIVAILVGGTLWIMRNLEHMQGMQKTIPFEEGAITPQTEND